jgi:Flp pilus assembly protein CpaB
VVVLTEAAVAGETLDPGRLAVVEYGAGDPPAGAFGRVEEVAFRTAAVALPARLPLVPSLVRAPGQGLALRPGERAVGVRVDEVGGLPGLLRVGARVDVLRVSADAAGEGGVEPLAEGVEVLSRPRATADGDWAVAVRVPAAAALAIASAEAEGARITLLAREAAR